MMLGMTTEATRTASGQIPVDTWITRVIIARTQRGMDVSQAAAACGLNRSRWGTWEREGRAPRNQLEVSRQIAQGLGYDLNWLLLGGPLASEHSGPEGPDGLPRLDSNQRTSDYMSDTQPVDLMEHAERRRNSRSNRPRNPFRRKPSQEPQYPIEHPAAA